MFPQRRLFMGSYVFSAFQSQFPAWTWGALDIGCGLVHSGQQPKPPRSSWGGVQLDPSTFPGHSNGEPCPVRWAVLSGRPFNTFQVKHGPSYPVVVRKTRVGRIGSLWQTVCRHSRARTATLNCFCSCYVHCCSFQCQGVLLELDHLEFLNPSSATGWLRTSNCISELPFLRVKL